VASWNFGGYFPPSPDGRVSIVSIRFLQDVGPIPYLLVPTTVWLWRRFDGVLFHLSLSALFALFLSSAVTLTKYPENTSRFVNLCVVLGALPVGSALVAFATAGAQRDRALRAGAVVAAIALMIANWPLFHLGIMLSNDRWYPPFDAGPRYNQAAIEFLTNATEFRDGILTIPYDCWDVLGAGQFVPVGSYVGDRGENAILLPHLARQQHYQ
jgi:hypothetical protein